MRTYWRKLGKWLLFLTPLLLGAVGLIALEGKPILDSLFQCTCMYLMGYQDSPPNLLVELARWTAPLATASWVLLAVAAAREKLQDLLRYLRGDSVAVYGPKAQREILLAALGRRGIDGGDAWRPVRAQSYLLLGTEQENFTFYQDNRGILAGRTVYLQSAALAAQSVSDPGLRLFCPEETAARLFWKQRCLYETSVHCGHRMRIVFVGFGLLGERLLTYALQDNIFAPDQRIEYHIFGDGIRFSAVHSSLSAIGDPVIFHEDPWYKNLDLLETAQMVAVLTQEEQPALVWQPQLRFWTYLQTVRAVWNCWPDRSGCVCFHGRKKAGPLPIFSVIRCSTGQSASTCATPTFTAAQRKLRKTGSGSGKSRMALPVIPMSARQITTRYACTCWTYWAGPQRVPA